METKENYLQRSQLYYSGGKYKPSSACVRESQVNRPAFIPLSSAVYLLGEYLLGKEDTGHSHSPNETIGNLSLNLQVLTLMRQGENQKKKKKPNQFLLKANRTETLHLPVCQFSKKGRKLQTLSNSQMVTVRLGVT